MPLILGIESTCDETAAAVVANGTRVLSSVVASQVDLHAKFRGVVPEIASRAHIENILPVLREAIEQAGVNAQGIDAVAVAHRPGLIGSLLIGLTAAKTLAWAWAKPLIGVDHVQAHLYSVMLEGSGQQSVVSGQWSVVSGRREPIQSPKSKVPNPSLPAVGLVCSGGHTALYELRSWTDIRRLGKTIDDAVGEAYDKVAAILGLGYPGGPIIDALAADGDARAVRFPRTLLGRTSLDFSFSGIKTAVLYHVRGVPGKDPAGAKPAPTGRELADVCASFQAACVDVLMTKIRRAIERTNARSVIVGGGVSANRALRAALGTLGVPAFVPTIEYCTDNAAMTAGLADLLLREGRTAGLDLDAITHSEVGVG